MSSAHQQPFAFPQAQPLLCQERGSASQDRLCPKIGGNGRNALMGQLERALGRPGLSTLPHIPSAFPSPLGGLFVLALWLPLLGLPSLTWHIPTHPSRPFSDAPSGVEGFPQSS